MVWINQNNWHIKFSGQGMAAKSIVNQILNNISLYYDLNNLLVEAKQIVMLNDFQTKKDEQYFYLTPLINCNGSSKIASRLIQNYIDLNYQIYIYLANEHQINNLYMWCDEYEIDKNKFELVNKEFVEGFALDEEKIVVITSRELFLQKITTGRYFTKFKSSQAISGYEDLTVGDYLVHENYGIGRYKGLETIKTGKINRDYLHIEYKNNEVLYVPLEQFSLVRKYATRDGKAPTLNKLGSGDWEKTKERIKSKVKDIAVDLIKLYEERTKKIGYSFSKDDELQNMFESDFSYVHTKDQKEAIDKIKKEMEKSVPMDMLLCGDVGYGKTEVAFRAIFKAINESYEGATTRISTSVLNEVLLEVVLRNPPVEFNGGILKISYAHQVSSKPPVIIVFVNNPEYLHFSYQRFLENKLRENFELEGTPIVLNFKNKHSDYE